MTLGVKRHVNLSDVARVERIKNQSTVITYIGVFMLAIMVASYLNITAIGIEIGAIEASEASQHYEFVVLTVGILRVGFLASLAILIVSILHKVFRDPMSRIRIGFGMTLCLVAYPLSIGLAFVEGYCDATALVALLIVTEILLLVSFIVSIIVLIMNLVLAFKIGRLAANIIKAFEKEERK